jgi:hypothetical protein
VPELCRNCMTLEYKLKQRDQQDERRQAAWDRQKVALETEIGRLRVQLTGFDEHNRSLVQRLQHRDTLFAAVQEIVLQVAGTELMLNKALRDYERGLRAERDDLVPA